MLWVQVNALGSLWLVNAVLPGMKERGSGKIVLVSSVGGGVSQFPGETLDLESILPSVGGSAVQCNAVQYIGGPMYHTAFKLLGVGLSRVHPMTSDQTDDLQAALPNKALYSLFFSRVCCQPNAMLLEASNQAQHCSHDERQGGQTGIAAAQY